MTTSCGADAPVGYRRFSHLQIPKRFGFWYCFMPTILRIDGLRVVVYPNDHWPEHIHVLGPDREAVFELHCPDGPVTLRESYGFKLRQLRGLMGQLNAVLLALCCAWENIHDSD